jgi:protein KTI12
MPLIVVCGIPGSGKTTRAQQIRDYLVDKHNSQVVLINEESLGISKTQGYAGTHRTKQTHRRKKSPEAG